MVRMIAVLGTMSLAVAIIVGCSTLSATTEQEESLTQIEEFPNLSADELYDAAETWVARSFRSANDVVQLRDPGDNQLIAQGTGSFVAALHERYFDYTMIIELKDGRMRVRYENIKSKRVAGVAGPDMNLQWHRVESELEAVTADLVASIGEQEAEDDW